MNLGTNLIAATCWCLVGAHGSVSPSASESSPPEASESLSRAETLRAEAQDAYRARDYDQARSKFEDAHALDPDPRDIFNIGRVLEESGDITGAVEHYETFANMPELALDERAFAAERLEVLRKLLPEPEQERNDPPRPTSFEPAREQSASAPDRRFSPMLLTGSALAVTGVVGAAVGGTVFGLRARRADERVAQLMQGTNSDRLTLTEAEDLHAQGQNANVLLGVSVGIGAALAATGAALAVVGAKRDRNRNIALSAQSLSVRF